MPHYSVTFALQVVEYKQQSRLEEKRKKALDLHLSFIVDQTEKYSLWLTEGFTVAQSTSSVGTASSLSGNEGEEPNIVLSHSTTADNGS